MKYLSLGLLLFAGTAMAQEPPPAKDLDAPDTPLLVDVLTGEELEEISKNPSLVRAPAPKEKITADEAVDMPRDI